MNASDDSKFSADRSSDFMMPKKFSASALRAKWSASASKKQPYRSPPTHSAARMMAKNITKQCD